MNPAQCKSFSEFLGKVEGFEIDAKEGHLEVDKLVQFVRANKKYLDAEIYHFEAENAQKLGRICQKAAQLVPKDSKEARLLQKINHASQLIVYPPQKGTVDQQILGEVERNLKGCEDTGKRLDFLREFFQAGKDLNQATRKEIALLSSEIDFWATVESVNHFGIRDSEDLIDLAKQFAEIDGNLTVRHIKNFGIKDQQALVEIAKLCAKKVPHDTVAVFSYLGIRNESELVDIVLECFKNGKFRSVFQFNEHKGFDKFKSQAALIQIAKEGARHDPLTILDQLKRYRIQDKQEILEIIKICTEKGNVGSRLIFQALKDFKIKDQISLIELAKHYAKNNTLDFMLSVSNFGITDQSALQELAIICFHERPSDTLPYFERFGFTDQQILTELAKSLAKSSTPIGKYIHKFGIANMTEKDRIEIATSCANSTRSNPASTIDRFQITDQNALVKIAKKCAQTDPGLTAANIKKFGIINQDALADIATLCIQEKPRSAYSFDEFGIEDHYTRVEIAKLCAKSDLYALVQNIGKFKISDPNELKQLFLVGLMSQPGNLSYIPLIEQIDVTGFGVSKDAFKNPANAAIYLFANNISDFGYKRADIPQAIAELHEYLDKSGLASLTYSELLKREGFTKQDSFIQKQILEWLGPALYLLREMHTDETLAWMKEQKLISGIMDSRSPSTRWALTKVLAEFKPDQLAELSKMGALTKKYESKLKNSGLPKLLHVSLINLKSQGVSEETIKSLAEKLQTASIFKTYKSPNKFVILVEMLQLLYEEKKMPVSLKEHLLRTLHQAENKQEFSREFNSIHDVLMMETGSKFSEGETPSFTFEQILRDIIPMGKMDGFSEKFQKTFGASRNPRAIQKFLTRLQTLNNPSVMNCLGKYIESVLNETFPQQRNSLENNPHLLTLHEKSPTVLKKWRSGLEQMPMSTLLKTSEDSKAVVVDTEDAYDLLLSGTDVEGSCQIVDGDPLKTQGLLGLLMDGKNRIIAVKDSRDNILARAIIRLLWDGEKPVMLMEGTYRSATAKEMHIDAVRQMAKKKAIDLGIPLLQKGGAGEVYPNNIQSLGSSAPFEYVDAARGIQSQGRYNLGRCELIE